MTPDRLKWQILAKVVMTSEEGEGGMGSARSRCCMKCGSTYPALFSPVVRLSIDFGAVSDCLSRKRATSTDPDPRFFPEQRHGEVFYNIKVG